MSQGAGGPAAAIDRDVLFVEAALAKELISTAEAEAALATARTRAQPVSAVLVAEGLIAPRTVEVLERDSQRLAAVTVDVPPPGQGATAADAVTAPLAPPAPSAALAPGRRIGGFDLLAPLGEGGMGAVWRARQVAMDREVAVKVIAGQVASDPEAADRFLREARAAAAVNHPHVISLDDVGDDRPRGGPLYLAMELVSGGDAGQLLERSGGRLPERRVLELARDCCRGLAAIHGVGLVHRDLKPANVFLTGDGAAKLADLGLARKQAGDDRMTHTGVVIGTPAYMAPEQANGALDLDARTDVYGLGATLFHLATGEAPFQGPSPMAVIARVLHDDVPDPRAVAPRLSTRTAALIRRAMAKEPGDRFESAAAMLAAVERALAAPSGRRVGVSSDSRHVAATAPAEPAAAAAAAAGRRGPPRPGAGEGTSPLVVGAIAVGVLVPAVLGASLLFGGGDPAAATAARSAPSPPPAEAVTSARADRDAAPATDADPGPGRADDAEPGPGDREPAWTEPEPEPDGPRASLPHGLRRLALRPTGGAARLEAHGQARFSARGDGSWARQGLVPADPAGAAFPRRVAWIVDDLHVERGRSAAPQPGQWEAERGFPSRLNRPDDPGVFVHVGLRSSPDAVERLDQVASGVVLTLRFSPGAHALGAMVRVFDGKPGPAECRRRDPCAACPHPGEPDPVMAHGIAHCLEEGHSGLVVGSYERLAFDPRRPLAADLEVHPGGWRVTLVQDGAPEPILREWTAEDLDTGLPGALRRGVHPWAELGAWDDGAGRLRLAGVEAEPIGPDHPAPCGIVEGELFPLAEFAAELAAERPR